MRQGINELTKKKFRHKDKNFSFHEDVKSGF